MTNKTNEESQAKINSAIVYEELFEPIFQKFAGAAIELTGNITRNSNVIDIAAGTGALSLLAAKRGAHVLAVDISQEMLDRLSKRLKSHLNCTVNIMDGQHLDIPDAAFDVSFSVFGVMIFPDWRKGLQELARVTRKGGRGCVVVFHEPYGIMTPYFEAYQISFPEKKIPPLPEGIEVLCSVERLNLEMVKAGFANVDVHEVSRAREWLTIDEFLIESNRLCAAFFPSTLYTELDDIQRAHFNTSLKKVAEKYLTDSGLLRMYVDVLVAVGRR
jgi:ubiquinone/menaquinone biosynthesis C-methylase UbiE